MLVSWGRSSRWVQLDSRRGHLRSVEVGRSISPGYDGMLWLTKDAPIRLLSRTAGRTWVRCCRGRTARNSESLRGLRYTLQERRGRGKARALLGPLAVRTYLTGTKALPCQSRADERTRAKALPCPKPCGRADENEGFAVSKPCERADENEGFVG